jgi:prepilin-type N-terminal cleavage/methylation domain-containing protein
MKPLRSFPKINNLFTTNTMKNSHRGFTLIELIVVMAVFMVVLMITGEAFKTILQQSSKLFRSEESNIEGVVGLEMLRHDLQQAGYGLFTHVPRAFSEANVTIANPFNNASTATAVIPSAVKFGNDLGVTSDTTSESGSTYSALSNSDYIAIKATTVGRSSASQRWTYLKYVSSTVTPHSWASNAENFITAEKVLVMERVSSSKGLKIVDGPVSPGFYYPYSNTAFTDSYFSNYSTAVSSNFVLYGLDDKDSNPRMPFNRTDYFVAAPASGTLPPVCALGAGILYKTIVNNSTDTSTGGKLTYYPVLDCVLNMQVILGWDLYTGTSLGNDGNIDVWTNADATKGATADSNSAYVTSSSALVEARAALKDPSRLRTSLKLIKVYILAQNGRKDSNYTSPSPMVVGNTKSDGTDPQGLGYSYTIPSSMINYRWKVYQVTVRPKNLTTNQ